VTNPSEPALTLAILHPGVGVRCVDAATHAFMTAAYGAMRGSAARVALGCRLGAARRRGPTSRSNAAARRCYTRRTRALVALFDEGLTIRCQTLRPDLDTIGRTLAAPR
jgi:hypothetical protein